MRKAIILLMVVVVLAGCAGTNRLQDVGRYQVQEVYDVNIIAPSVTALVAVDPVTGDIVPLGSGGSAGVAVEALQIGGILYLGSQVGSAFPDELTIKGAK